MDCSFIENHPLAVGHANEYAIRKFDRPAGAEKKTFINVKPVNLYVLSPEHLNRPPLLFATETGEIYPRPADYYAISTSWC